MRAHIIALEGPPESRPGRDAGRAPDGKVLGNNPSGGTPRDLRFRALMRHDEWNELPAAIRRRFCKHIASGQHAVYVGEVVDTYLSRGGWWLAQMARLVGGPLPLHRGAHMPSVVSVTTDKATGGQTWTRT